MSEGWKRNLKSLFDPQSIAIIGASEKVGPARNVLFNLKTQGYSGGIYPVNPKYSEVFGYKCYPSIKDIPTDVDAVAIGVPARFIPSLLEECIEKKVNSVCILTGGFAELNEEGKVMQEQIKGLLEREKIPMCGPNSLGLLNVGGDSGLYSASIPPGVKKGGVAVLAQSGSMVIAIAQAYKSLGLSKVISTGNQAVLDLGDYLHYLADDPQTKVIAVFMEGVDDGRKFLQAAEKALAAGKPVIVLKVGRSAKGRKITQFHTGAMAGEYKVFEAAFSKTGIVMVKNLDEMAQTVTLFVKAKKAYGKKAAFIAISGGQSALITDLAEDFNLELAEYTEETRSTLREILPDYLHVNNPLDVADFGSADADDYARCLRILAGDDNVDLLLVSQDAPQGIGASTIDHYSKIVRAVLKVKDELPKQIIVFSNHSTAYEPKVMQPLVDSDDLPYLLGTEEALAAVKKLIDFNAQKEKLLASQKQSTTVPSSGSKEALQKAGALLRDYSSTYNTLGEKQGKRILQELGIASVREAAAQSAAEAVAAAEEIGYPVALKVDSAEILHKTDLGCVKLNLQSPEEVRGAYHEIIKAAKTKQPSASIEGVLVQKMAPEGFDVIIGLTRDPQFGPTLLFGSGGIFTEILDDVNLALLPLGKGEAEELVRNSRAYQILKGARRSGPYDLEALYQAIEKVAAFGWEQRELLKQVDINPLRVYQKGKGVEVLDALFLLQGGSKK
ncbi:MAG: acetate--CoA ligase family protein [Dethiobacteria bacterium]|jgi:acyl-CoA synthetase (NDP forming)|nr:acetate--CoA ligase family protein [Bacillota bacterium]